MACSRTFYILRATSNSVIEGRTWEVCQSCLAKYARRENGFYYAKCGCEYEFITTVTKDAPQLHIHTKELHINSHNRSNDTDLTLNVSGLAGKLLGGN